MAKSLAIKITDLTTGDSWEYETDSFPFSVGRDRHCDIPLNFKVVSSRHIELYHSDGTFFALDLDSTNGTFIGDIALTPHKKTALRLPASLNIAQRFDLYVFSPEQAGSKATTGQIDEVEASLSPDPPNSPFSHLHAFILVMRDDYESISSAFSNFRSRIDEELSGLDTATTTAFTSVLMREFPLVYTSARASSQDKPRDVSISSEISPVGEFALQTTRRETPPRDATDLRALLTRASRTIRLFSKAILSMGADATNFARKYGVEPIAGWQTISPHQDPKELLSYLLDWDMPEEEFMRREESLVQALGFLILQRKRLLASMVAGVRDILVELEPDSIENEVGVPWPARASALWSEYKTRFTDLIQSEDLVAKHLLGPTFRKTLQELINRESKS